jgi:hypothetical protein
MKKYLIAFLLGLGSFFLFWGIGEYLGSIATTSAVSIVPGLFVLAGVLGAYAFACQRFLSRGDPRPVREQWRLLLSFNFILTAFALAVPIVIHKWSPTFTMLGLTAYSWACACAGAAVAARGARKQ